MPHIGYKCGCNHLQVLALDGAKRFEGFEYDVEADIEAYKGIAERVLPMCACLRPC